MSETCRKRAERFGQDMDNEIGAQVQAALAVFDEQLERMGGCTDHSCRIRSRTSRAGGMGTNGGCRCFENRNHALLYMNAAWRLARQLDIILEGC